MPVFILEFIINVFGLHIIDAESFKILGLRPSRPVNFIVSNLDSCFSIYVVSIYVCDVSEVRSQLVLMGVCFAPSLSIVGIVVLG